MSKVDDAMKLAAKAHAGQVDKAGRPYIFHPVGVAAAVADEGEIAMCVALLHDVVEDTHITIEEIEMKFGAEVADPVALLTKPEKNDPGSTADDVNYDDYLDRICDDPIAVVVKLADVRHNLGRLEHLDAATADRLRRKYEPRVGRLEAAVDARTE